MATKCVAFTNPDILNMKTINKSLFTLLALFSSQLFAASTISIGPYALEADAAATSASFTGSVFENVSGAITDTLATTYIKGESDNAAVSLGFDNIALSNQAGNDLALFFITASNTVSLDINGVSSGPLTSAQLFINSNPFVDNGNKYLIENIPLPGGGLGTADLSVIFIDLNDFGLSLNQSISSINVNIANNTSLMNIAIGLNSPVPLPAPILLLLSGLAGIGIAARRKK